MACIVTACIVIAYTVVAHVVMACMVMAFMVWDGYGPFAGSGTAIYSAILNIFVMYMLGRSLLPRRRLGSRYRGRWQRAI